MTTSAFAQVNPAITALIGWPLLGERPTVQTIAAGAIILTAVTCRGRHRRRA